MNFHIHYIVIQQKHLYHIILILNCIIFSNHIFKLIFLNFHFYYIYKILY